MSIRDPSGSDSSSHDEKLDQAIMEFLRLNEDGTPLDIAALLKKHATVADELEEFINQQIKFGKITTPVREFSPLAELESDTIQEFGDYEIIREIGRGGMGVIYEARQKGLSRRVALKMIRETRFRTQEDLARFQSEAEAAAALEHSNIVPVYRVGSFDGQPFFTMKLVRGGSLKEALEDGPMPPEESARVALAIARGVSFAHQHMILHRDLKPANILMDSGAQGSSSSRHSSPSNDTSSEAMSDSRSDGLPVAMISDFGLAKQLNEELDQGITVTGAVLGTPSFMAPEQAMGIATTTSTDIYSVGAILYNMLTGDPPFTGNSPADVTRKVIDQAPRRIGWKAKVDLDLETICMKCLEKEPARRYGAASELADDLESWIAGKPIRARRSSAFEQLAKWARRHPRFATLLCSSIALLVLTLAGAIMFSIWLNTEKVETSRQRDLAIRSLFDARFEEVASRRTSGDIGQQFGALAAAKEAVSMFPLINVSKRELFELRSETAGCLANADIEEVASWRVDNFSPARMNGFNHDLSLFVDQPNIGDPVDIHETKELIRVGSVDKSKPIASFDVGDGEISGYQCQFSKCGQYMGVNTMRRENGKLTLTQHVFDIDNQKVIYQQSGKEFFACFGEHDSEKLLATSDAKHIAIYRLPGLEKIATWNNPSPQSDNQMFFSPDGKWLARCGGGRKGAVFVFDVASGEIVFQKHFNCVHLEWHPSKKEFAISNLTSFQIWNFETTPRLLKTFPRHPSVVFRLNSAAGGSVLAASTWGFHTHFWDTHSGEQICSFPDPIDRFSKNGRSFGFCGDISGICRFDSGSLRRTISNSDSHSMASQPQDLDVHPNDRWVALGDFKNVRICDLKTGRKLVDLPGRGRVRFHPDGKSLFIGEQRLRRWPIKEDVSADGKLKLTLGPPEEIESIDPKHANFELDIDPTGRYLAYQAFRHGAYLVDLEDSSAQPVYFGPLPSTRGGISVSKNGRLVAIGNQHKQDCTVFDGKTGAILFTASTPSHARGSLSPDGKLLAVTYNNTADVYDTETQKIIYSLDEPDFEVAWPSSFSKDGTLLLFTLRKPRGTLVVDAATGERLIRIPGAAGTAPRDARSLLTNDYQLVTIKEGNALESWDLATIRNRLSEIGLDWDSNRPTVSKSTDWSGEIPEVEVLWDDSRSSAYEKALMRLNIVWSWDVAEQVFDDWLADSPNDPDLWYAKARVKFRLGDRSALQDIARTIELFDDEMVPEIHFLRAQTERSLNARENVAPDLATFLNLYDGKDETRMDAVNLLAWELALAGKPQHEGYDAMALATDHLAWVGKQESIQNDSGDWLQHALQIPLADVKSERQIVAMKTLGLALLRAGKPKVAMRLLESIKPSPSNLYSEANSGVEFLLAMCEAENGNEEVAMKHFNRELSSQVGPATLSVAAAADWLKLRSLAEKTLAEDSNSKTPPKTLNALRWSAIELAAQSSRQYGLLSVQFRPESNQLIDAATGPDFKKAKKAVSNLRWRTKRPDGELTFELNVTKEGSYDGRIHLARSFDYGMFEFGLNGTPVGRRFDGQAEQIVFGDFVDLPDVELRKGINRLTVRNVGKSRDSEGFDFGIESLEFSPN